MKTKISTVFISVLLIGLLVYGFISLNSDDPYADYGPGTETGITNNGNPADTTPPANWPYITVWNFYHSPQYPGTVGASWFEGKYYNNRWSTAYTTWYRYLPNGPGGGPGDDDTINASATGTRDMTVAPDGSGTDFLWGGTGSTLLRKFNKDGVVKGTYVISGANFRAIAWDPNRKGFWNASWTTDIRCHDTTGTLLGSFTHTPAVNSKYGMAWDSCSSPDSAFLWVWGQQTTTLNRLTKIHLGSMTIVATYNFPHAVNIGIAGGAEAFEKDGKYLLALNYQGYAIVGYELCTLTPPLTVPEVLYYTFDETGGDSTENYAIPGRGFPWAPLVGTGQTIAGTGQWGNALNGTGTSSSTDYVNTGWTTDIGTSSWTISLWLKDITTTFGYLFGDNTAGSWRSFLNGAAGTNNIILRGGGMTDLIVTGVVPGPNVVTFVYDSAAGQTRGYKNGVLVNTKTQTPLNINGTAPFKVGGYSTSAGLLGKMDEFRLYDKALSDAEVAAAWNHQFIISGITPVLNIIPEDYALSQNYPNPFNPTTTIKFNVPVTGMVILKVYDVLGKEVASLVNEVKNAGSYTVDFDGSELSSGAYFYRIEAGDYMDVKKMVLLK